MCTDLEEAIEDLINLATKAYKKNNRNHIYARKLNRREPVVIDGIEFSCWREYSVYKTAELLKEQRPNMEVEVVFDGNDSVLTIEPTEDDYDYILNDINEVLEEYKYACF